MALARKKALGRGLDALLAEESAAPAAAEEAPVPASEPGEGKLFAISPDRLRPGVHQPRTDFDEEDLAELAESVRAHGILQPILVRRLPNGDFEIVAGERRWRAARLAGLAEVPVLAIEAAGGRALEIAIIENVQRSDLNPMEEASAFQSMVERLGLTQEEVAARVGKERSTVANYIRLLRLPAAVQEIVAAGDLSMGHARALLSLRTEEEMTAFARAAARSGLSVRQLEGRIRKLLAGPPAARAQYERPPADEGPDGPQAVFIRDIAARLRASLGTKVTIQGDEKRGRILIEYYSSEVLEGLADRLS
ncbi:MAG: ParB/RepB/Spo0J family partition protein [Candidatus Tectomicrobia bacterium]|uniref:ParB/RepB/Spo0J family partition protein n=1 Tax=Tectimicrobiota bacterium TaxID=2528274 RepID=A0A932HY55_UNCTE|nr:ParB/RepB/Spo0J family partition protein [Candidatus Tectomicrobia bacterium]